MATTYLTRTPSSNGSATTATMSAWVKRAATGEANMVFGGQTGVDGNNRTKFGIDDTNQMVCQVYNSGSYDDWKSTRLLRDCSGWYNLVFVWDTTNATPGDRIRFYCNGDRITDFATQDAIPENAELKMNTTSDSIYVGARKTSSTVNQFFNGCMSHIHYIDGTAYEASTFGSTDATTGEWNINTSPTVTYGTNGFFILEDGNGITDQSGEGNDLTLGAGTLTNTEDNPSNVFCALNPLNTTVGTGNPPSYANANNYCTTGGTSSSDFGGSGTLGLSKGVWYYEGLVVTSGDDNLRSVFGINSDPSVTARGNQEGQWNRWAYTWKGYQGAWWTNTNSSPGNATENVDYLNTYTNGDYIGVYFDLDNSKMLFTKNGVLERSGVSMAITAAADTDSGMYFPVYTDGHSAWVSSAKLNFGNGVFGSTALTGSEDSDWFRDAGGQGKFKYNPTQTIDSTTWDARAICTKNINTYG